MDDTQIVDLYWARSHMAIQASSQKYGGLCQSIAMNILGDRRDVEECVNDTWLGAWNAMPPQRPAALSTFLGRITRNLALDRWRQAHAKKRGGGEVTVALEEVQACVPAPGGVEAAVDDMALTDALNRFLLSLPQEPQRFFVQRYWYLCSIREIANNCGASAGKVKMSLLRSRQALQTFLEKEGIAL